jgi:salicylate hydroxylase
MKNLKILIAGGGIGGLATAIALAHSGHHVEVRERRSFVDETGAAVQLGPNAWHALARLGLQHIVKDRAVFPDRLCIRDGQTGKLLTTISFDGSFQAKFHAPYATILRAQLHAALLEEAKNLPTVELASGCEVTTEDIRNRTEAIIAADGINSSLRTCLFPGVSARSLPFTIFRSMPNLAFANADIDFLHVTLWLCRNGHVVHYPSGNPSKVNLVAVCSGEVLTPRERLQGLCPPLDAILRAARDLSTWPAQAVPFLPQWHAARVCLIGDAAHGTVPFLAQGAAMALEDAVAMAAAIEGATTVEAAFQQFETSRRKRTARLDAQSQGMPRLYHAAGPLAFARNMAMQSGLISSLQFVTWLYRHSAP